MQKGSLSIDLDNLWAYLKVKGDTHWHAFPSYFETFVPSFLDFLDEHQLTITFFVVGQDAALDKNRDFLKEVVRRGHEVANHSFHHEPSLKLKSAGEAEKEILEAEEAIRLATGKKTVGFRGPGFCYSPEIRSALEKNGYLYDSSLFPSSTSPLARLYFSSVAKASVESKSLYGNWQDAFKSLRNKQAGSLIEMPVTTIPYLKLPFHMTYLLFLASYSESVMDAYLSTAIQLCRVSKIAPNFLLHPTDFMGSDRVPEMSYFPGMDLSSTKKMELCAKVISKLNKHFALGTLQSVALEEASLYSPKSKR